MRPHRLNTIRWACAGLLGALGTVLAQTPPTGSGSAGASPSVQSLQPGAIGVVSGQTPSQQAQAAVAPVADGAVAPEYSSSWWGPGSGLTFGAPGGVGTAFGQSGN